MKIGRVDFMAGDEYIRPSVWIERRNGHCLVGYVVLFFGWQKPSILWL